MREHLDLGNVKAEDMPEDTLKAVVETLRKSASLKLSEDGEFHEIFRFLCHVSVLMKYCARL